MIASIGTDAEGIRLTSPKGGSGGGRAVSSGASAAETGRLRLWRPHHQGKHQDNLEESDERPPAARDQQHPEQG